VCKKTSSRGLLVPADAMRKTFVYAVLADLVIAAIVLHNQILEFLLSHPWWISVIAALPEIAVPILAWFELRHSREANELRAEANNQRIHANTLQEEANELRGKQAKSLATIAEVQAVNIQLQTENVKLQAERNEALSRIALNTQRVPTEAENNARILKKYLGQRAFVTQAGANWGSGGAVIAEVNENNILTLFNPAGYSSSRAWGQPVRCDKLHVVEVPAGSCPVQINIVERYGNMTDYGEAKSWDERNVQPTHVGMPRGQNVFNAQYRKEGSPRLRHIYVYGSTDGSPNYTMVTLEDEKELNSWSSSKLDVEKKFAVVQVEWADEKYFHNGGGGSGSLNFFIRK
jgi:hypothetical protein